MQLFVDIDGVLLNFEQAFVYWLNRDLGLELPAHYEADSWNFTEILSPEAMEASWHRFMESEHAGRLMPMIEPAVFNTLAARHTVHLVTNFPGAHMPKRRANLDEVGFAYHGLHYCGLHDYKGHRPRSKAETIECLHNGEPALFVDDLPENCLDVHRNCPEVEVWLMGRRFNRGFEHPGIRRSEGWQRLLERLEASPAASGATGNGKAPQTPARKGEP